MSCPYLTLVSTYVSDFSPIDDDPQGLMEQMNEIKLVPTGAGMFKSRFPAMKRTTSPLATSRVISNTEVDEDSVQDTVRSILAENNAVNPSSSFDQIDEYAISKLIESGARSVLTGNQSSSVPMHFGNQVPLSSRIEQNTLSVYSDFDYSEDATRLRRMDTIEQDDFVGSGQRRTVFGSYDSLLAENTGRLVGISLVVSFFIVHGIRIGSGIYKTRRLIRIRCLACGIDPVHRIRRIEFPCRDLWAVCCWSIPRSLVSWMVLFCNMAQKVCIVARQVLENVT